MDANIAHLSFVMRRVGGASDRRHWLRSAKMPGGGFNAEGFALASFGQFALASFGQIAGQGA
jgi:hypothetical protein